MSRIYVLYILCLAFACTKEEITPRKYPRVRTLAVANITDNSVLFKGNLIATSAEISDHGFLWLDQSSPTFENADRISLGPVTSTGNFETVCERGMIKGKKYYVRAYVSSPDFLVYSQPVEFISQGSKPPVLTDFYPTLASWGDTITLAGMHFSAIPAQTQVRFNDINASIISASSNMIKVRVPYVLLDETSTLSVIAVGTPGNATSLPQLLQLKAPVIESVSPPTGSANSTIVISGKYLSSSKIEVYFNNVRASITNLMVNSITCKVPGGLPAGQIQLKVVTGNGNLYAFTNFESE